MDEPMSNETDSTDMLSYIGCRYSCHACWLVDVVVQVPVRAVNEDVVRWVEQTLGMALGNDHLRRSPTCRPLSLSDVKIPVQHGAPRIGDLQEH